MVTSLCGKIKRRWIEWTGDREASLSRQPLSTALKEGGCRYLGKNILEKGKGKFKSSEMEAAWRLMGLGEIKWFRGRGR